MQEFSIFLPASRACVNMLGLRLYLDRGEFSGLKGRAFFLDSPLYRTRFLAGSIPGPVSPGNGAALLAASALWLRLLGARIRRWWHDAFDPHVRDQVSVVVVVVPVVQDQQAHAATWACRPFSWVTV